MATLAEAKSELGHVQRQIDDHKAAKCPLCPLSKGKRCAELVGLSGQARELREQIRTWFAPSPDDANLFDPEG